MTKLPDLTVGWYLPPGAQGFNNFKLSAGVPYIKAYPNKLLL